MSRYDGRAGDPASYRERRSDEMRCDAMRASVLRATAPGAMAGASRPRARIRPHRQTLYWSAMWPKEIEQLARQFLYNSYEVIIGSADLKANHAIQQRVEIVLESQKYNKLIKLLEDIMDGSRILIFIDTKKGCDQITRQLRTDGWPALSIHGDKSQAERDWVLSEFKAGWSPIMTATDVAARGLDVKDVKYVIKYDFPGSLEDYVHHIGRGNSIYLLHCSQCEIC